VFCAVMHHASASLSPEALRDCGFCCVHVCCPSAFAHIPFVRQAASGKRLLVFPSLPACRRYQRTFGRAATWSVRVSRLFDTVHVLCDFVFVPRVCCAAIDWVCALRGFADSSPPADGVNDVFAPFQPRTRFRFVVLSVRSNCRVSCIRSSIWTSFAAMRYGSHQLNRCIHCAFWLHLTHARAANQILRLAHPVRSVVSPLPSVARSRFVLHLHTQRTLLDVCSSAGTDPPLLAPRSARCVRSAHTPSRGAVLFDIRCGCAST
jgi:hypothetical protein